MEDAEGGGLLISCSPAGNEVPGEDKEKLESGKQGAEFIPAHR